MRGAALAIAAAAGLLGNVQFRGPRNVGDVFGLSSLIGQQLRYRPTNKGGRRRTASMSPLSRALATIKTQHCAPPAWGPAERVTSHMRCPRCGSRLNFTVETTGKTSGRCVTAECIRWSDQ